MTEGHWVGEKKDEWILNQVAVVGGKVDGQRERTGELSDTIDCGGGAAVG